MLEKQLLLTPRRKILIAVLLLVFAAVKAAAVLWWQQQQPEKAILPEAACNVHAGCTLPDGSRVKFSDRVSAKQPFDIRISGVRPEVREVFVQFSMSGMDMGFNRYPLARQSDGTWEAAQIRLPVCVQNRRDYLADIHIGGQVFQTAFTAD